MVINVDRFTDMIPALLWAAPPGQQQALEDLLKVLPPLHASSQCAPSIVAPEYCNRILRCTCNDHLYDRALAFCPQK